MAGHGTAKSKNLYSQDEMTKLREIFSQIKEKMHSVTGVRCVFLTQICGKRFAMTVSQAVNMGSNM